MTSGQPTQALPSPAASQAGPPLAIDLAGVSKVYGRGPEAVIALDGLDLSIADGAFVSIVGASGCGKSTLLSLIAGLDKPTAGSVKVWGGHPALIFQEAALFPWLTAAENIELPLRLRGMPRKARRERVADLLEWVHLTGFARMRPHELSGGMRQRVAIARALAQDVRTLLMDEPFGALDAITRDLLHEEMEALWRETGMTIVFVTHNVREAVRLSGRVVLLSSRPGRVVGDFPIRIDGERRIEAPEVSELAIVIGRQLGDEVRRHGLI